MFLSGSNKKVLPYYEYTVYSLINGNKQLKWYKRNPYIGREKTHCISGIVAQPT